ncbi:uncharacterized protein [Nicotiana tomentosiformis]|uniref:uncharacterized protein n=1 Tax=Nicotiana tomentosiformis TaxID=4098 RepID=UPI00051B453E|nr:uncharacterized protein LOC117279055 [Nicotiana tomentosiformis]
MDEFIPQKRRERLCSEFDILRQEGMTVTQYAMRFTRLSRYTTLLVSTEREWVHRFVEGLTYNLRFRMAREIEIETTFHQVVEIARRLERINRQEREDMEAKEPRGFRGFSGSYSGAKGRHGRGYFSRPVQSVLQVSRSALASLGF